MSGTTTSPMAARIRQSLDDWGKVAVSVIVLIVYGFAHLIAWKAGGTQLDTMLGADGSLAAAVVYYWVGSSSGSQKKDDTIAKMTVPPVVETPKA